MGEDKIELGPGKFFINGCELGTTVISDFECDTNELYEEHKNELFAFKEMLTEESCISFKVKFNIEAFYKLTGLYDWVYENCPNRRVVHLMKYGKTKRIRKKNFRRALNIIGMILDKKEE